ncbi:MAG TPA: hypothetical protein VJM47_03300 [Nitrosospira sp.]|nr:hypothetical protein [Nitrosospira sp.]
MTPSAFMAVCSAHRIGEQIGNAAYAEAIKLIRKAGELMKVQGLSRQFGDYLASCACSSSPSPSEISPSC